MTDETTTPTDAQNSPLQQLQLPQPRQRPSGPLHPDPTVGSGGPDGPPEPGNGDRVAARTALGVDLLVDHGVNGSVVAERVASC
jgi:hypothetical protein